MTDEIEKFETLDPIAFVGALIAAPVLVALLGFWAVLIPVFALIMGGPIYLAVGAPVLLAMVTRVPLRGEVYACVAFIAQSVLVGTVAIYAALFPEANAGAWVFFAVWGLVFAPIWAGVFALLYRRWHRPARLFPVM